jgi:hypothetical protein
VEEPARPATSRAARTCACSLKQEDFHPVDVLLELQRPRSLFGDGVLTSNGGSWVVGLEASRNRAINSSSPEAATCHLDQFTRELDVSRAGREWTACDRSSSPAGPRFRSGEERLPCDRFVDSPKGYVLYPRGAARTRYAGGAGEVPRASSNDHGLLPGFGR